MSTPDEDRPTTAATPPKSSSVEFLGVHAEQIDSEGYDAPGEPDDEPAPVPRPYDPTGLDLASRIAQGARGGRPPVRRRPRRQPDEEVAWSGPGPSARDPRPVGQLLDRMIAEQGWRKDLSVAALLGHWADFVGEVNAAHTKPERFRNGQLIVRAESTTWATALRLLAPTIVARLNQSLGEATVQSIRVLGPQAPSWKKGPRSVRGRGPRDTYG